MNEQLAMGNDELIKGEFGRIEGVQIDESPRVVSGRGKLSPAQIAALLAPAMGLGAAFMPAPRRRTIAEWDARHQQSQAAAREALAAAELKRARKAAKRLERGL